MSIVALSPVSLLPCSYVVFEEEEAVDKALALNMTEVGALGTEQLLAWPLSSRRQGKQAHAESGSSCRCLVLGA